MDNKSNILNVSYFHSSLKNEKRGVIFGLYLVMLTIFMMGVVIVLYLNEQKNVNSLLVSPIQVLQVRDNLSIFEMRENEIGKEVFLEVGGDAGAFKKRFLDKVEQNEKMKEFLIQDLDKIDISTVSYRNFLEDKVYMGNFEFKDGKMIVKRSVLGKRLNLRAMNADKEIRFPVTFYFEFSREFKVNAMGAE